MGQRLIDCADDAAFMLAQRIARLESERDMRFNNCLFGNTPWQLVLELYIAKNGLSRADLLQRVSSPSSTSGRYLKALEQEGIVDLPDAQQNAQITLSTGFARSLDLLLGPTDAKYFSK